MEINNLDRLLFRPIETISSIYETFLKAAGEEQKKKVGLISSTIRPDDGKIKETHHFRTHEKSVFRIHHLFAAGEEVGLTKK